MKRKNITFLLLITFFAQPAFASGLGSQIETNNSNHVCYDKNSNYNYYKPDTDAVKIADNYYKKDVSDDISSKSFVVVGLYKYDVTTSDLGQYYFSNEPFATVTNRTSSPMQVSDTFSKEASVKLFGSIQCESEGKKQIKSNFGFEYNFSDKFSRTFSLTLKPNTALKVFVEYQKIEIEEKEYKIDPMTLDYIYNKTRTKVVYKPTGLTYIESR